MEYIFIHQKNTHKYLSNKWLYYHLMPYLNMFGFCQAKHRNEKANEKKR